MTRGAFYAAVAEATEMTKRDVAGVFDAIEGVIKKNLAKVGRIPLGTIGTVVLSDRKARMGRNPATGESIKIKAKRVVKLRPAKGLKEAFNKVAK